MLLLEHLDNSFLVVIDKLRRIEIRRLGLEDVLGELQHLRSDLYVWKVVEVLFGVANFVRIAQCRPHQPLVPRLKHNHPLALAEYDPRQRHHIFAAHRLADHGEGLLADLVVRSDVIGAIQITFVDLFARNEGVDLDGVRAFDGNRVELFIVNKDVGVF